MLIVMAFQKDNILTDLYLCNLCPRQRVPISSCLSVSSFLWLECQYWPVWEKYQGFPPPRMSQCNPLVGIPANEPAQRPASSLGPDPEPPLLFLLIILFWIYHQASSSESKGCMIHIVIKISFWKEVNVGEKLAELLYVVPSQLTGSGN